MKTKFRVVLLIIFIIGIAKVGYTYIRVEYLTKKYQDELSMFEPGKWMLGTPIFMRVLDYKHGEIKVLIVDKTKDTIYKDGDFCFSESIYTARKNNSEWELVDFDTIWATCGNANGTYYPWYPSFLYN